MVVMDDMESTPLLVATGAMGIMTCMFGLSLLSVTQPVIETLSLQSYQGKADPREVTVTDELTWLDLIHEHPYTPWISAYIINDGPNSVEVAINYPNDRFVLNAYETTTVSRVGARERIAIVFLKCAEGETADVRITGEY